jgi:hypothetical protein
VIGDGQDLIDWLSAKIKPEPVANGKVTSGISRSSSRPDEIIIEKCRAAENAAKFTDLYDHGDVHAHHQGDDSRADLALLGMLAFWTQDEAQLERIFSSSALGQRAKWRRRHDYRERTIQKALSDLGEVYDWGPQRGRPLLSSSANSLKGLSDDDNNEDDLDGIIWFSEQGEPKEREYLIESVAVKKYTIVAYGAGGVAKSFAVLAAGIAIAGGSEEWLGLQVLDHGYVLYLDFELDAEEQHRRVRDLCAGLGVDIPEKLAYFSALGMTTEQAFRKARAFVKKYKAKAVIIDSMGLAMSGDMDHAKDVIAFHRQYTDQLRALGTTPFVVDHEGKLQAGENRKEKGPTGSAFKSWTTRSVLQFILEEYDEEASALDIRVRHHKTNFKPTKPFGVRFTFADKMVSIKSIDLPDTELIDEIYVPVKERIVAALKSGEATIKELAQFTGAEVGTVRNKLSELMGEGKVEDAGYRGREKLYKLPEGTDFVTQDEPEKDEKRPYPSDSLLSSSANVYRDLTDDDNNDETQAQRNENKEAQTGRSELQGNPATVEELFANPPEWFQASIENYREDPDRWFPALCAHVAAAVLGDGLRWEEVRDEVERELRDRNP